MNFKRSKRLLSVLIATIMFLTAMPLTAIAQSGGATVSIDSIYLNALTRVDECVDLQQSSVSLAQTHAGITPLANYNAPQNFSHSSTLTTSNPIDYFYFSVTGARTVLFGLQSTNNDVIVMLLPCDSAGNILSGGWWIEPNIIGAITEFNSNANNNYVLVIFNDGNIYPANYTISMNATNPNGLTNITYNNSSLSIVSGWKSGVQYTNGVAQTPTITDVVTITGLGGGVNFTYNSYGMRYRIQKQQTLTVSGSVSRNGAIPPVGTPVTVRIQNNHFSESLGSGWHFSEVTGSTNAQGNFTINVTAPRAAGAKTQIIYGAMNFEHFYDDNVFVIAKTANGTSAQRNLYLLDLTVYVP